jgi:hypothetical protein
MAEYEKWIQRIFTQVHSWLKSLLYLLQSNLISSSNCLDTTLLCGSPVATRYSC